MASTAAKEVTIYTDGGCEGNPGPGGWAAVLMHGAHRKEINGGDPATTNNRMELMAAIEALRALKMPCKVALHTDSQYVKNGITQWIKGWKAKGWKTASREPVKNAELWRALDAEVARHDVSWHWVKGHAGHEHNERCDVLAGEAIAAIKKQYTRAERRQLLEAQAEEKRGETLL